jgi:valyl-tRNA synthetase
VDAASEQEIELIRGLIVRLRNIRGENDIASSRRLSRVYVQNASPAQLASIAGNASHFDRLANATVVPFDAECDVETSATATLDNVAIYVPLRGLKEDLGAERARLAKLRDKAQKDLASAEARLGNEEFLRNAPAEVAERMRERVVALTRELEQVGAQLARLEKLK